MSDFSGKIWLVSPVNGGIPDVPPTWDLVLQSPEAFFLQLHHQRDAG